MQPVGRIYPITPCPAPRMTQSDKWRRRPCVLRYRAFRDECRDRGVLLRDGDHITFILPMPPSWSERKKAAHDGTPHRDKPDCDNLLKALMDALFENDCHIYDVRMTKIWGRAGAIKICGMVS